MLGNLTRSAAERRVASLEALLAEKGARLQEVQLLISARENEIREEMREETLKQEAEIERLKTMMSWKAKIVEDDVRFRTETEWRKRSALLIQEIDALKIRVDNGEMEKIASDAALEDAAHRLSQCNGELEVAKRQNQHLQMQLQSIQQIRNTVQRLHRSTNDQWQAISNRDQSTMERLQKEQEYFRLRQSESVPHLERKSPARGNQGKSANRGRGGARRQGRGGGGGGGGAAVAAADGGYGYAAAQRRRRGRGGAGER